MLDAETTPGTICPTAMRYMERFASSTTLTGSRSRSSRRPSTTTRPAWRSSRRVDGLPRARRSAPGRLAFQEILDKGRGADPADGRPGMRRGPPSGGELPATASSYGVHRSCPPTGFHDLHAQLVAATPTRATWNSSPTTRCSISASPSTHAARDGRRHAEFCRKRRGPRVSDSTRKPSPALNAQAQKTGKRVPVWKVLK